MGILTQSERERLEAHALAEATQNKPSHAIVVALREALLEVTPEEEQPSLAFPPVGLSEERTTAAGRARS